MTDLLSRASVAIYIGILVAGLFMAATAIYAIIQRSLQDAKSRRILAAMAEAEREREPRTLRSVVPTRIERGPFAETGTVIINDKEAS